MAKTETAVPGSCALHMMVTENCRRRPNKEWLQDVLDKVKNELTIMDEGWPEGKGVQFHVAVTCERP